MTAELKPRLSDFEGFYKLEIEPWLRPNETRLRLNSLLMLCAIVPWTVGWIAIVGLLDGVVLALLGTVVLVVGIVVLGVFLGRQRDEVNRFVIQKLAEFFKFTHVRRPDHKLRWACHELQVVPSGAGPEYGLTGVAEGVPFELLEFRSPRGSVLVVKLAYPPFAGSRVLLRRNAGSLGNWRANLFRLAPRTHLDDVRFEERFQVYSADPAAVQRLLDPNMRHTLLDLAARAAGKHLAVAFDNGHLWVGIGGTDRLDPGALARPRLGLDRVRRKANDLSVVFDVVNDFNLRPTSSAQSAAEG